MDVWDERLRELAGRDEFRLPEDYDGMLRELYDRLPQEEEKEERAVKRQSKRYMPRVLAAMLALVMLLGGGLVGALTASTVIRAAEPESITMEELGLTLLLPDSWRGKYGVDMWDNGTCAVYVRSIHEGDGEWSGLGYLFYVARFADYPMTPEQVEQVDVPVAYKYLMATSGGTYLLYRASDVQWDPEDPAQEGEYRTMESEISQIRVVAEGIM